jgi:hypothetical protein
MKRETPTLGRGRSAADHLSIERKASPRGEPEARAHGLGSGQGQGARGGAAVQEEAAEVEWRGTEQQLVVLQAAVRRWGVLRRLYLRKVHRHDIMVEILETERTYVHQLEMLVKGYLKPIINVRVMSEADVRNVFSNVSVLLPYNKALLETLCAEGCGQRGSDCSIGKIFLTVAPYFTLYTECAAPLPPPMRCCMRPFYVEAHPRAQIREQLPNVRCDPVEASKGKVVLDIPREVQEDHEGSDFAGH